MSMKSARYVLLLSAALSPAAHAAICPATGHEYRVVSSPGIDWTEARSAAQALAGGGWDLASIGSAEENACVVSLLPPSSDFDHYWIGATDLASEGTWAWLDGTTWAYTNWALGAPNNWNDEDYLAYEAWGSMWFWNDVHDDLDGEYYDWGRGYVAERIPPESTRSTASIPTLSHWASALLSGLLAGAAVVTLRRRSV